MKKLGNIQLTNANHKLTNAKSNPLVFFSILLVFVSGLFSGLSFAQQREIKLFVAPELFELKVKPGQVLEDKIKIFNKSEIPIPIQVKVTNFGAQEETGAITFFEEPILREGEEDDISYNPRKWIKIENPNFILDPGKTEKVKFKIEIPENAEPKGHYTTILFEPRLSSYFQEGQVQAIPIIGVLVLLSVKAENLSKPEEILTIVEFSIPEKFHLKKLENFLSFISEALVMEKTIFPIVETSHLSFTLKIKNNDIYHIKAEGKLVLQENKGKTVGETKILETTILPGKVRNFSVEFKPSLPEKLEKYLPSAISNFISQNLLWGKYKAHLVLTSEDNIIKEKIEFWVFPWKIVIITLFILILLFLIRKRIVAAIKVLVSPKLKV